MAILFTNNALTTLAGSINNSGTTLAVAATTGANFPVANGTSGDYFVITMEDSLGHREFIKVPKRSSDTFGTGPFPCVRGYWGSTARSWTAGDSVDLRWSADAIEEYLSNLSGRYLGAFATAPTVDAFGSAVLAGDIYYDNVLLNIYQYNGAAWVAGFSLGASAIANVPAGNISAIEVQSAINELDTAIDALPYVSLVSRTASSSATLDFTDLDGYAAVEFVLEQVLPSTDGVYLCAQVSTNNGSTYITTASYDYALTALSTAASSDLKGTLGTNMVAAANTLSNAANLGVSGTVSVTGLDSLTKAKYFEFSTSYGRSSGVNEHCSGMCVNSTSSAINAVRFFMSSGTIASGTITANGIKRA